MCETMVPGIKFHAVDFMWLPLQELTNVARSTSLDTVSSHCSQIFSGIQTCEKEN